MQSVALLTNLSIVMSCIDVHVPPCDFGQSSLLLVISDKVHCEGPLLRILKYSSVQFILHFFVMFNVFALFIGVVPVSWLGWGRWCTTISNFVSVGEELHEAYFKCDSTVYHYVQYLPSYLYVCERVCVCVCVWVPKRCTCQSVWRSRPYGRKYVAV